MKEMVYFTARIVRAGIQIYARKWSFLVVFAFVFLVSIVMLGWLDLLPATSAQPAAANPLISSDAQASQPAPTSELPVKIEIPKIGLIAAIANPATTNIATLDEKLLSGAVRYPTSAKLGEEGNIVLFGHSSYLPVVINRAYKTFNGIQELVVGDSIVMYSADAVYTYQVRSVEKASANDAGIELAGTGRVLTLSTCDSFGRKTDRFVVVADFVESHSISI